MQCFFYTFVATLEMLESYVIGCFVPFCMNCGISGHSCNRFRTHKSAIFKIGILLKVSELHYIFQMQAKVAQRNCQKRLNQV